MMMPMGIDARQLFKSLTRVSNAWRADMDFSQHLNKLFKARRAMVPGASPFPATDTTGRNVNVMA
ncbi:MAG TPA: hypothetical protein DCZ95_14830 [Verrucomicrobia bacterium]|nr:MAG: hypothetical protein A2X46_18065 [Lentisphaerae bacterium GWF2_57_35]HBA85359.1 hypothetical protein [Verrucomicrobiota bacterium]